MGLAIAFTGVLTYLVFILLSHIDRLKNIKIKKDRILENTAFLEYQFEKIINIDNTHILKKYRRMIKESTLSKYSINITILIIMAFFVTCIVYGKMYSFFEQPIAALLIAAVVFILPFQLLELEVSYRRTKIRKHLPHFLLMFQQTYNVTGTSIGALQAVRENIKEPIKGYIKEFLRNISKGMDNKEAIEKLKERSDNHVFKSFCDNIYSDIEFGKTIKGEIDQDIKQAYMHEENYIERITQNSGSISSIAVVLLVFILGIRKIVGMNDDFMYMVRNTSEGKIAINIVIALLIMVFAFLKYAVSYKDTR